MANRLGNRIRLFEEIFASLQAAFPEVEIPVYAVPLNGTFVTLAAEYIHPAAQILVEQFDFYHLSTITGDDTGEGVCVMYHFWNNYGITLRVVLPYDNLHVASLTDLIPGASFYEREVFEMLGVTFDGHPHLERLFLPDDWDGGYPLRRE